MTKSSPFSLHNSTAKTFISFFLLRLCIAITTTASFYSLDLSSTPLDPLTTGFRVDGVGTGDFFGTSVAAIDIDKDGFDDMIIGGTGPNSHTGAVYVIYGGLASSFADLDLGVVVLDPLTTGFTITGSASSDNLGYSVGAAGDVDKDGYEDFIIGGTGYSGGNGVAYVIYGGPRASRMNIDLSSAPLIPSITGFIIKGNTADSLGLPVRRAGDINQDGYSDLILGANGQAANKGAAYVIYGGPRASRVNIDLSSVTLNPQVNGFYLLGDSGGSYFGFSVSTAGDIDKDGYDDMIIGAYGYGGTKGAIYVVYGGPKASMINYNFGSGSVLSPSSSGFMITGSVVAEKLGFSVGTAGDINKDGFADIVIGSCGHSGNTGKAYVVYGGPRASMTNIDLNAVGLDPAITGFTIQGNVAGDQLGVVVSPAGDINKDGYPEILLSAYYRNSYQGAVYVIYGGEKASTANIDLGVANVNPVTNGIMITGITGAEYFGRSITTGDLNKDGYADIMIGASRRLSSKGAVYVIYSACSQCWDCSNDCIVCDTSPDVCTQCSSPTFLSESECVATCPSATFGAIDTCEDCEAGCSFCTSLTSCVGCAAGYILRNSECVSISSSDIGTSSTPRTQDKASQGISSGARGLGSIVCVGSSTFSLTALVSKIVQNTRYLNLTVTNELAELYQTWDTDLISWEVPNVLSQFNHFRASPVLFARYGLGSPFLENFWPTMVTVGIGLACFVACLVLRKLFERAEYKGWFYSVLQKLVAGAFNFTLTQIYGCLDDVLFYLVLDAKTNPRNNFFSWASLIGAVLFMVLGCLLVLFNLWTVNKYQGIKKDERAVEAFNERNKYWELFYSDFDDSDFWSQSFFAVILVRSTVTSLIITVFYEYPLMQSVFFLILDQTVLMFLYFKSPFTKLLGKLAQYYFEIITLLVHLCTFVLSLQDTFDTPSEELRTILSTAIIYLNTALIGGSLGFMFIEVYEVIKFKSKRGTAGDGGKIKQEGEENSVIRFVDEENQEVSLATSPDRNNRRFERSTNLAQQMNNDTSTSGINMEPSLLLETNFNFDLNMQRDRSMSPMVVVRSPARIRRQKPHGRTRSVPKKNIRVVR